MTTDLRSARPDDEAFLLEVYASTRAAELALTDWTPEQKGRFVQMQYAAQKQHYEAHYPGAEVLVILRDGAPAGRMILQRTPGELRMMDLSVLPPYRGAGVGTGLLRDLQTEAGRDGRRIVLHVESENRALDLYRRMGFTAAGEVGAHVRMEWSA